MTADLRRRLRVLFKLGLLVSLPITGYMWAIPSDSAISTGAIVMTILSVVMALGAEGLASVAETELTQLRLQSDVETKQWNTEISGRDEKIRQMDRLIETLSTQNHDLRGKLVSVHGEMGRLREEEEAAAAPDSPDGTPGEITDLTSLRSRR